MPDRGAAFARPLRFIFWQRVGRTATGFLPFATAHGNLDEAARCQRAHLSGTLSWIDAVRTKYLDHIAN